MNGLAGLSAGIYDLVRQLPNEDCALGSYRYNVLLVRRNSHLGSDKPYLVDWSGMAVADPVALCVVVAPQFDHFIVACADEHVAVLADCQRVDLAVFAALDSSDDLAVEGSPVRDLVRLGYLSVSTGGQDLALVWMESNLLEQGALEETHQSGVRLEVPDNARSVRAARKRLFVVAAELGQWRVP